MLDRIRENIIEISIVYCQLILSKNIYVEDSFVGKQTICELAEKFEELHKNTDWNEKLDYHMEIEKFAKESLMDKYASESEG